MQINELDTPAVLIDLDVVERNLRRMADYARQHGLALRPHTKTHKIPELAQRQLALGACGVTVAKVSEARVMIENGVDDVMIAYPLVTEAKAGAAAELAHNAKLRVSLDSVQALEQLARAADSAGSRIGVLAEIDTGFHRCGVASPSDAIALARLAERSSHLDWLGLMFYPGHLAQPPDRQAAGIDEVNVVLDRYYQTFHDEKIALPVISGGSTPTGYRSHEFHGITEIRPGTYIYNDGNYSRLGASRFEDCAVKIAVTVISTAVSGKAMIDGGSKTFSSDRSKHDVPIYGTVIEDDATRFVGLSEEHGHLDISQSSHCYRVADRLHVIPNHVCAAINLHNVVYGVRGDTVEKTWQVAARGRLQ